MPEEIIRWKTIRGKDGNLQWEGVSPYNKDEAFKKFKPEESGIRYGQANRQHTNFEPTSDEVGMVSDVNEHIGTHIQDWHSRCVSEIGKDLNLIGEGIDPNQIFSKIKSNLQAAGLEARENFLHINKQLLTEEDQARRDLNAFRGRHKGRPSIASYPESYTLHFGLIFIALVVEGVANSYFFSDNPIGLIGGFLQAFLFSLANVVVSFIAGWYCLREIHHQGKLRKVSGTILLSILIYFLCLLHLATAHYREALMQTGDAELLTSIAFSPNTLQDMQSIILILIGGGISVFAMYKGFTFDDPYPGYGKVYRIWKKRNGNLSEAQLVYKNKVNAVFQLAVQEIDAISARLDSKLDALKNFETDISTYFACVDSYYSQAQVAASSLITAFRGGVETSWGTPGTFPVVESKLLPIDPSGQKANITARLEGLKNDITNSIANYKKSRGKFISELEDFRETQKQYVDKEVGQQVTDIKLEAEQDKAGESVKPQGA
ncbi:MAG: hypothetical protein WA056_11425 [Gallionella sp.]